MIYQTLKVFNCIRWCTKYCYKKSKSDDNNNNIINSNTSPSQLFLLTFDQLRGRGGLPDINTTFIHYSVLLKIRTFAHIHEDWISTAFPTGAENMGGILQNLMDRKAWVNTWGSIVGLKIPFLQSIKKSKSN